MNRREVVATGVAALAATGFGALPGWAATLEERVAEFTGGAEVGSGGITLTTPEIAENGNTVPIEVEASGAVSLAVFAPKNPDPRVAIVSFGPLSPNAKLGTRIRLAGTQDVTAIAKMADGSFVMAANTVKVTIGGCGG